MKKILINLVVLSFLFALTSIAYCQNYDMNINLNNGSTVTFAVDDIQRIEFDNVTSIEDTNENQQVVQSFKLMRNFPNPFNPATTIEYQIPKTAKVSVRIYNISGQLVKEIFNETQDKGVHRVTWDGTSRNNQHVASGIYIYTVKSDDLILSKKMILLR